MVWNVHENASKCDCSRSLLLVLDLYIIVIENTNPTTIVGAITSEVHKMVYIIIQ